MVKFDAMGPRKPRRHEAISQFYLTAGIADRSTSAAAALPRQGLSLVQTAKCWRREGDSSGKPEPAVGRVSKKVTVWRTEGELRECRGTRDDTTKLKKSWCEMNRGEAQVICGKNAMFGGSHFSNFSHSFGKVACRQVESDREIPSNSGVASIWRANEI